MPAEMLEPQLGHRWAVCWAEERIPCVTEVPHEVQNLEPGTSGAWQWMQQFMIFAPFQKIANRLTQYGSDRLLCRASKRHRCPESSPSLPTLPIRVLV